MIGKLLRFALMEKDARRKWEAEQAAKADRRPGRVAPKTDAPKAGAPDKGGRRGAAPAAAPKTVAEADEDPAETVRAAIAAAEREMLEDVGPAPSSSSTAPRSVTSASTATSDADRERLIRSALAVHKLKQSAFADLDAETRARLRVVAERMLGVDKPR
ncbi:hypothetical protein KAJ83_13735 [Marivibrio halodurans]|uniref:Uncharacterized protein n=1 Tax=Marivibrio halodurans TaxID=2039722 RepID=A0A8J7V370_9PROT|nr:hypothetical protein [Marivibrio halodurans]MBP5858075.1 hypothetical protein [Marivibrio halodurans]